MSATPHSRSPTPTPTRTSASTSTPPSTSTAAAPPSAPSPSTYFSYPVSHVVSSLYRRLTDSTLPISTSTSTPGIHPASNGLYTPPPPPPPHLRRTASPFQPPPLTPLSLKIKGINPRTSSTQILSRALAEEIRLLLPPRLQLAESWLLAYSLEEDGVSLGTLYQKCASSEFPPWSSFVLVVRDAAGGVFGAYLTSAPHPSATFYGTGECFLWRASLLRSNSSLLLNLSLPRPPSAPTDGNLPRSTTLVSPSFLSSPPSTSSPHPVGAAGRSSTPDRIRFQAFPDSGVNNYFIFCEHGFLSVGGGDGRYGLWLDEVLERGVSSSCLTFGNEPLSEEGEKFEVVGVEVWCLGC